mmetsp:Transcript_10941/g.12015  ORF Transcript_10941/g.12015 Transcript_10941/m.12015 type:complete len:282 (-) Transcript_10941:97-942(-)
MSLVNVSVTDKVCLISINRQNVRNCVNGPTAVKLAEALIAFDKNPKLCVAVLYGEGGCFCAGADLKAVSAGWKAKDGLQLVPVKSIPEKGPDYDTTGPMGFSRLLLSKPVIAAVEGFAVAGGLELACWCDMRTAAEDAVFGVFCRRWGVPLLDGGTTRLPRLIGLSRAMDMILTGRPVTAPEGLSMGLVNRVVPRGTAVLNAVAIAKQISSFPQATMRADRMSAIRQYQHGNIKDALRSEYELGAPCAADAVRGATIFAVKKKGRHGSFSEFTGVKKKSKL